MVLAGSTHDHELGTGGLMLNDRGAALHASMESNGHCIIWDGTQGSTFVVEATFKMGYLSCITPLATEISEQIKVYDQRQRLL